MSLPGSAGGGSEQDRITRKTHRMQRWLDSLDADSDEWRDVLTLAARSQPTATAPTAPPAPRRNGS